jgi:hypothetical protein
MSLAETIRTEPEPTGPRDPVFERWSAEDAGGTVHVRPDGFLWLPARGMGRLPTSDPPYDTGYFENYARLAATPMGRAITAARVDLVRRFTDRHVVDIGIGCGAFISARMGWTWGYDVNPAGIAWLHSVGRWCDPYAQQVESVSMWDVLEHIEEPARLLAQVKRFVFLSLPIVPGDGPPSQEWRHYKPKEHAWYWNRDGLVRWFAAHGFVVRHASDTETQLGRLDIGSFVFERVPR